MSRVKKIVNEINESIGRQYKSLNDSPILEKGNTKVWYLKKELLRTSRDLAKDETYKFILKNVGSNLLKSSHVLLGSIKDTDLEQIFTKMQGEFWSPEGEANSLIKESGTGHTSMSMGDIIELVNGDIYCVADTGFEKLN